MYLEIADIPFDLYVPVEVEAAVQHLFSKFISCPDQRQKASFSVFVNEQCALPDSASLVFAGKEPVLERNGRIDEQCAYRFSVATSEQKCIVVLSLWTPGAVALIFSTFKWFFTFMVLLRGGLPLHSSSIIHQGKGFLFSGDSGKGKSTISSLLTTKISGTRSGSDELNVLYSKNNKLVLHSTPYHSSNGPGELHHHEHAEVALVFFLEHAALNRVELLKRTQVFRFLLRNSYHLPADALLTNRLLDTVEEFSDFSCFRLLHFINNESVVTCFKDQTDGTHATEDCGTFIDTTDR